MIGEPAFPSHVASVKSVYWGRFLPVGLVFVSLVGGILLGVSAGFAALAIIVCAVAFCFDVAIRGGISKPALFGLLFLIFSALSGVFLGGFQSLNETSITSWIANEGRVFLYYWPAFFIVQCFPKDGTEHLLLAVFRIVTVMIFAITLVDVATGFSTFSTHHAAGAFCAAIIFYNLFRYEQTRSSLDLVFLGISFAAMFATNSRTSLLAVFLTILLVYANISKVKQAFKVLVLACPLALAMPIAFPTQFNRLADAANSETFVSLGENFMLAYRSDSPIEVAKAFDLSRGIEISGNANLIIRGYLWGRSMGEGFRSPIVGTGFGRLNDLGRDYEGVPYLIYPATSATLNSPSNLTAHNGYLQVFAELGLIGSILLFLMYRYLWAGLRGNSMWVSVGRASIICLLLMSVTQHAFGAPIFGLSLMMTVALAYRMCLAQTQTPT